jgi:hypothetical protein
VTHKNHCMEVNENCLENGPFKLSSSRSERGLLKFYDLLGWTRVFACLTRRFRH